MLFITLLSLLKASQYMLRYLFTPTGAITDDEMTQARMLADAAAGPLKAKLKQPSIADNNTTATNNAWVALVADPTLSLIITPQNNSPPIGVGAVFGLTGPSSAHVIELTASGNGSAVVELRFNHSIAR